MLLVEEETRSISEVVWSEIRRAAGKKNDLPQKNNNDENIIAKKIASLVSLCAANEYQESTAAETDANQSGVYTLLYRAGLGYVPDL